MPPPDSTDWLGFCRRAAGAARDAVQGYANTAERGVETGRGEGGDTAYVIDRAAEDAIFGEIETLGVPVMAVSEERGEVTVGGEGDALARVVIDPVDGSLNAKRGLPFACVSIAVASGPRMPDVEVGWVAELDPRISEGDEPRPGRDWWAVRGEGAFRDGEPLPALRPGPLEVLGLETARPELVAAAAAAIEASDARRIRAVDAAAAQLLVTEAGGAVAFPADDELSLAMRSRVLAARDPETLERLARGFA